MEILRTNNLMEEKKHGSTSFPLSIYNGSFNNNKTSYLSTHWHNECEIDLITEGNIDIKINNSSLQLKTNDCVFINSNILHSLEKKKNNSKFIAIVFKPSIIYGMNDSIIKTYIDKITSSHIIMKNNEISLIKEIIEIYRSNDKYKEILIQSKLSNLIYNIIINYDYNLNDNIDDRIINILDFIYNNYQNKITIDDISKNIGLCRTQITSLFKKHLNITISDFIIKYRIEKSIPLLNSGRLNITEIAQSVGFNSSAYFTLAFKKICNTTPLLFKKKKV